MAKASKKSSKAKQAAASNKSNPKKAAKERKETYVDCPYTDQKVWISRANLNDLKGINGGGGQKKKRLWTITSSKIRQDHYADVAQALSIYEQNLLPSSGGRSWEVSVKLSEPNARVLFRSWKGQMEVCRPCILEFPLLLFLQTSHNLNSSWHFVASCFLLARLFAAFVRQNTKTPDLARETKPTGR